MKNLSTEDLEGLYQLAQLFLGQISSDLNKTGENKPKPLTQRYILAITLVALICGLGIAQAVHSQSLLGIVVALAVAALVLLYALSEVNGNFTKLQKEYLEYKASVGALLKCMVDYPKDPQLNRETFAKALVRLHNEELDVDQVLEGLSSLDPHILDEAANSILDWSTVTAQQANELLEAISDPDGGALTTKSEASPGQGSGESSNSAKSEKSDPQTPVNQGAGEGSTAPETHIIPKKNLMENLAFEV